MNQSVNKNILFECFSGRATPLQKKLIEQWLLEDNNREIYYEWLDEWEKQSLQLVNDTNRSFEKLMAKISKNQEIMFVSDEDTFQKNRFKKRFIVAIAASFLLFLSVVFLTKDYLFYQHFETDFGETKKVKLPDNSEVTLNAKSTLKFARFGFNDNVREVYLTGEASFTVKHTIDNQRFIVKTDKNFEVEVLGTEFNVNVRQTKAKVVLNKGKVQFNYQEGKTAKQITMKPGDLITLDSTGHANLKQIPKPQIYSAWKDHRFIFEQTPMREVATMIQENFGLKIEFREEVLSRKTISGAFHAENADELLQVISELLEINFNRQNNNVIFFE